MSHSRLEVDLGHGSIVPASIRLMKRREATGGWCLLEQDSSVPTPCIHLHEQLASQLDTQDPAVGIAVCLIFPCAESQMSRDCKPVGCCIVLRRLSRIDLLNEIS